MYFLTIIIQKSYTFLQIIIIFTMTTSFLKGMRTRTDEFKKTSFEIEKMKTCICSSNIL